MDKIKDFAKFLLKDLYFSLLFWKAFLALWMWSCMAGGPHLMYYKSRAARPPLRAVHSCSVDSRFPASVSEVKILQFCFQTLKASHIWPLWLLFCSPVFYHPLVNSLDCLPTVRIFWSLRQSTVRMDMFKERCWLEERDKGAGPSSRGWNPSLTSPACGMVS